jgi:hypothetical protein
MEERERPGSPFAFAEKELTNAASGSTSVRESERVDERARERAGAGVQVKRSERG